MREAYRLTPRVDILPTMLPGLIPRDQRIRTNPFDGSIHISSWLPALGGNTNSSNNYRPFVTIEEAIAAAPDCIMVLPDGRISQTRSLIGRTVRLIDETSIDLLRRSSIPHLVEELEYIQEGGYRVNGRTKQTMRGWLTGGRYPDDIALSVRLASRWIDAVKKTLLCFTLESCYAEVYDLLVLEREIERFYLRQALLAMTETRPPHAVPLKTIAKELLAREKVRAQPYYGAAQGARAAIGAFEAEERRSYDWASIRESVSVTVSECVRQIEIALG